MQIESDQVHILSGVRKGKSTGGPITLVIENKDYANWESIMSVESDDLELRPRALTAARPGHADLSGGIKYGHKDLRDVLERASARETAARVAVGAIALRLLHEIGIEGASFVSSLGGIQTNGEFTWDKQEAIAQSDLATWDNQAADLMRQKIDEAKAAGSTLGGILEIRFRGLPVGLGSYSQSDRRLDGQIAAACLSVQAMKGVEIGHAFEQANKNGEDVHDAIVYDHGYQRKSNRAGGLEGGMTNGEELIVRVAMKPIATLMKPLETVDVLSRQGTKAARERSDTTAVPAAGIILQCAIGWVLAQAVLEKFGGDTLEEIKERVCAYQQYVQQY